MPIFRAVSAAPKLDGSIQTISDHLKIQLLIRSYQVVFFFFILKNGAFFFVSVLYRKFRFL